MMVLIDEADVVTAQNGSLTVIQYATFLAGKNNVAAIGSLK
jgi:hypothetical protein